MPPVDECPTGAENRTRLDGLEKDFDELKKDNKDFKRDIWAAITEIRDKLLGRPSWVVLFMFSAMSSAIVALVCLLLKK